MGGYLGSTKLEKVSKDDDAFKEAESSAKKKIKKLLNIKGKRTPVELHRDLGKILWEHVGMARNEEGLTSAIEKIKKLREEFWENVTVPGDDKQYNQTLEKALRVADFMEIGELMARDALERRESCGGHFREESKTDEGEAKRDDENFAHAAGWEYQGDDKTPIRNIEPLTFDRVPLLQRSYK